MKKQPSACPNQNCDNYGSCASDFFRKRGYYTPKSLGYKLTRYQCKSCGKTFSNQTGTDTFRQHRQDINYWLPRLLCSGVTMRRAAWILKCSYNTVCARLPWFAEKARQAHERAMQGTSLDTSYAQFDEMQTFEHAAAKPLTIAVAVCAKTGQFLSIKVGRMPAKGPLAELGQTKYGWTVNEAPDACKAALREVSRVIRDKYTLSVGCDGLAQYPGYIKEVFPVAGVAEVRVTKSRSGEGVDGEFDPLFMLNHSCAKLRADLACLARKTWATTKQRLRLQDRLDLYLAVHNNYKFT